MVGVLAAGGAGVVAAAALLVLASLEGAASVLADSATGASSCVCSSTLSWAFVGSDMIWLTFANRDWLVESKRGDSSCSCTAGNHLLVAQPRTAADSYHWLSRTFKWYIY